MRPTLLITITLFLFLGCSTPTYVWRSEAKDSLMLYQKLMLDGDDFQADFYYRDALKEARKSSSVKPLAMIYLTSCAMHQALFKGSICVNFKSIQPIVDDKRLDTYEAFILGEKVDGTLLEKYKDVIEAIESADKVAVKKRVESLSSIYSKAVAASVVAKKDLLSEELIDYMINEASKHSMQSLVHTWMRQKVTFLKNEGNVEASLKIEAKLKFLAH